MGKGGYLEPEWQDAGAGRGAARRAEAERGAARRAEALRTGAGRAEALRAGAERAEALRTGAVRAQAGRADAGRAATEPATGSGTFWSDGRLYCITYPFHHHGCGTGHVDLVDLGPPPARGVIARVDHTGHVDHTGQVDPVGRRDLADGGATSQGHALVYCPAGAMPADLALALLSAAGITPPTPADRPASRNGQRPPAERPRYQEAAYLLAGAGEPVDSVLAGLVGIARVLLELSSEALGSQSSRALLGEVVKNLVMEVENPRALLPD